MNRTIKFRGKHLDEKRWYYGSLIVDDANNCTMVGLDFGEVPVDPATVGQFTGLTDKNGKEIFEGDIILIRCFTAPAEVYMDNNGFWAFMTSKNEDGFMLFDYTEEAECSGNIHDNPELLKNE